MAEVGGYSSNLPDVNIPDSKKDKDWHKRFNLAILNDSISTNYELAYLALQACYDYYDGIQDDEAWKFLQETEGGDTLPAQFLNFNKIKTKVDVLVGETIQKGYDIRAKAMNKTAQSRRLDEKFKRLALMRSLGDLKDLEKATGIPTVPGIASQLPADEEALNEDMKNWKDYSERFITRALKAIDRKYNWGYERMALFRDILIAGRCFCKVEIQEGMPKYRRIDPRYMVFDSFSKDDFLTDSSYFGELYYMTLAEARQKFNLTKDEIDLVRRSSSEGNRGFRHANEMLGPNNGANQGRLRYVWEDQGKALKVMVFYAYWQDNKKMRYLETEDKFGNKHYKSIDEKEAKKAEKKKKGKVVTRQIKIWRKCTVIGGQVIRDWGEMENMIRSVDNIADTLPPYVSLIPNYMNFRGVSKVEQLKGLQDLKDISMYSLQLAMARAGAKGFVYDVAQCPDEYTPEEVISQLKVTGIALIDSKKDGVPNPYNAFSEFDMTISSSIEQYLHISRMVDQEMAEISGINEARQGVNQKASQAVGVTQQMLTQSALSTEVYSELFRQFSEKVMSQIAGLVKIVGEDGEVWGPIIGDDAVDFIKEDVDITLQDYSVFIDVTPPILEDRMEFKKSLDIALQQGAIRIDDYLDLALERDIPAGVERLKATIKRREEEMAQKQAQAQQQMAHQQAFMAQQAQQQKMQDDMSKEQFKGQRQMEIEQERDQNKKEQILLKSRVDEPVVTNQN